MPEPVKNIDKVYDLLENHKEMHKSQGEWSKDVYLGGQF